MGSWEKGGFLVLCTWVGSEESERASEAESLQNPQAPRSGLAVLARTPLAGERKSAPAARAVAAPFTHVDAAAVLLDSTGTRDLSASRFCEGFAAQEHTETGVSKAICTRR